MFALHINNTTLMLKFPLKIQIRRREHFISKKQKLQRYIAQKTYKKIFFLNSRQS